MSSKTERHPFRTWARRARRDCRPAQAPLPPLTPEQQAQLKALDALCLRLGHAPSREELPPCLRLALNASFGSLRVALGHMASSRQEGPAARCS